MSSDIQFKYLKSKTVDVIGASFSGGQPKGGVELGPNQLIEHGLAKQLQGLGWNVNAPEKFEDLTKYKPDQEPVIGNLKNVTFVSNVAKHIHEQVKESCSKGHLALTLGGDHSIGMGTVSGSAATYPDLGVIWVDAHADINTAETTESGNLHGCPVSFLMGLGPKVPGFEWLTPCLNPSRIVFVGLRDVDAGEKKILKQHNIKAFSMHEVDRYGIGRVMEMAFDYLGNTTPIHLSFDVDALDPTVAPATGTPVRGGLTFREGHYITEVVAETGRLVSMDLMEVNPALGTSEQALLSTIEVGNSLIRCGLGETLL